MQKWHDDNSFVLLGILIPKAWGLYNVFKEDTTTGYIGDIDIEEFCNKYNNALWQKGLRFCIGECSYNGSEHGNNEFIIGVFLDDMDFDKKLGDFKKETYEKILTFAKENSPKMFKAIHGRDPLELLEFHYGY